ncbi:MAG: glucose 1-dehydrogenase [Steroidobacteraceae bacterium]
MKSLAGKVAIVTGGNSGIGRATAKRLAQEGAHIAIVARSEVTGHAAVGEIVDMGERASFHRADITRWDQVEHAMHDILSQYGKIDIAFNNAGSAGGVQAFDSVSTDEFEHVLRTNVIGLYHCMKLQIRQFLDQGNGGVIVNCASVSGLVGVPYQSAYCASKHAVVGLTKSVALEYADAGIRINAVCPGGVLTPMLKKYLRQLPKDRAPGLVPPIRRPAAPVEIANMVAWLCSDQASYVVGQAYAIDGGYTTG